MSECSEAVAIIRPSFMKFCKDGCRAAAFNHLLYWIGRKAKSQPKEKIRSGEISWYGTSEVITSEGLHNAWGVCKVRGEVNKLIKEGLIGRGKNTSWGADRTKHFYFGEKECAKFLDLCEEHQICLYHIGLVPEVWHLINSSNANDRSIKCYCKQMIDPSDHLIDSSDANDESIEAITKITTKIYNKGKDTSTYVASANADDNTHAPSSFSDFDLQKQIEETQNALNQLIAKQQSQQQPSETTQNTTPDQQEMPTMPFTDQGGIIAQTTQTSPKFVASDHVEAMPQKPNAEQASSVSYSPGVQAKSEDVVVVPSPAKPTKPRTKKAAPPSLPAFDDVDRAEIDRQIAEEKAKEEERKEKHRTVYAKIVARRGRELEKGKIAFERTYINKLLENWTPEQIDRFHQYLMEEDWRWSKVDNKYRITAKTIYDEAGSIDLTLNDAAYKSPNQIQKKEEPKNESDRATRLAQLRDQVMQAENPVKKAQDLFKSEKGHAENDAIRKALKDVLALQKDRQVVQTA